MVWGVEMRDHAGRIGGRVGQRRRAGLLPRRRHGGDGIHLLGPLAKKVVRIAPPLVITQEEAAAALDLDAPRPARRHRCRLLRVV